MTFGSIYRMDAHALQRHPRCREFRRSPGSHGIVWSLCSALVLYVAYQLGWGDAGVTYGFPSPYLRSLDPSVSFAAICDTLRIGLTPGWVFTSTPTDGPYVASFKMVGWVKLQAELRPGVTIAEGAESIIGLAANGGVKNMKVVTSFFLRPAIQELIGQNEIVASGVLPFYERISALPSPGALGWVPSESNSADSTSRL